MNEHVGFDPPLWIGGPNNREVGIAENILSGQTPTSAVFHLEPVREYVVALARYVSVATSVGILLPGEAEYSVSFLESIQRTLSEIDAGLVEIG